ncbi:tumor necrosis factor alpha-induced protein 8-like [Clavelina lepadiformis]|uniref:Tumor necrosis factor alpha-induced protein 8-like protein n=1 Tax=Clavelina lepadiformis TaxID=159417 RepID=A0ABP0F1J2_CLALP
MGDEVQSKDLALKAQKKILGKMASKNLTKMLIDEKTADILDEFCKINKLRTGNKKETEKLVKNLIKVMIKVAVLQRNDQFTCDELKLADKMQQKTKMTAMTIVSFYEVDFTFDKYVLSKQINEQRAILQQLVASHLTPKSKDRINSVFDALGDTEFLESLFEPDSKYRPHLSKIALRLNELIDEGVL